MKSKRTLNQTSFLLLITIALFFVMYVVGCVLFKDQGFAKTQNFLNLFISNWHWNDGGDDYRRD